MFVAKTICLSKKISNRKQLIVLFDISTSSPCLYPLLFTLKDLRFKSLATQSSDLGSLKCWYEFWYEKFTTSFCESFYSSSYDPDIFLYEIDNFIIYMENNKKIESNLIRLRNNQNVNYKTIAKHITSILKFHEFLLDEYWCVRYQPEYTKKEIESKRSNIDKFIKNKKKIINGVARNINGSENKINKNFKSMTKEMIEDLYKIIAPNPSNMYNPFLDKNIRFRNFLIVHLMFNYGLRVGELMLLTIDSIKGSLQNNIPNNNLKYSLIIVNTDDEFDNRFRKPNIKTEDSNRTLELDPTDYKYLMIYINKIRKETTSRILFTTLTSPYSPLSYSSIDKLFSKLDTSLRELNPQYFDRTKYDAIDKLTPHVCRHTWVYMQLTYSFGKYHSSLDSISALDKAEDDLRQIAGWSKESKMPSYYGKRFIVERANYTNLERIRKLHINYGWD